MLKAERWALILEESQEMKVIQYLWSYYICTLYMHIYIESLNFYNQMVIQKLFPQQHRMEHLAFIIIYCLLPKNYICKEMFKDTKQVVRTIIKQSEPL